MKVSFTIVGDEQQTRKKEGATMKQKEKKTCPVCHGEKVIAGICECSAEWRGTQRQSNNDWADCKCTPEQGCAICKGTGLVEPDQKK